MSDSQPPKKKRSILKPPVPAPDSNEGGNESSTNLPTPLIIEPVKSGKVRKKKEPDTTQHRGSGFFNLTLPSFLGGSRSSKESLRQSQSASSFSSRGSASILSSISDSQTRNHVRFLDKLSVRSISAINIRESFDGDNRKTNKDLIFDPTFLPGFVDLYYSKEIAIKEKTRCHWFTRSVYQIVNEADSNIYIVEKHTEALPSVAKFFCFFAMDVMRVGFKISVYNKSVSAKLITFRRHSHWFAEQLDIVEIFYSLEDAHVGRIEKILEGFRIVNARGAEMYRVLRDANSEKNLISTKRTLVIFSGEKRRCLGKIVYLKRRFLARLFPLCMKNFTHVIKWSQDMEVTAKVMLIGVLFLELHSNEAFVDFPLGSDATSSTLFRYQSL